MYLYASTDWVAEVSNAVIYRHKSFTFSLEEEGKVLSKLDPKVSPDVQQRLKPRQGNSTDLSKEGRMSGQAAYTAQLGSNGVG